MSVLDDVAAQLVRLQPKDSDRLAGLKEKLLDICGDLAVEPYLRYQVGEAVRALTVILNNTTDDPAAALAEAVKQLEGALGHPLPEAAPDVDAPAKVGPLTVIRAADGGLRVRPEGDLTAATATALRDALSAALAKGDGATVLDLASTREMDGLGLCLVLGLFKTCHTQGRAFSVESVGAGLLPVFRLLNLAGQFPVKEASL